MESIFHSQTFTHFSVALDGNQSLELRLFGDWKMAGYGKLPTARAWWARFSQQLDGTIEKIHIICDVSLDEWDDRLVSFVHQMQQMGEERGLIVQLSSFPQKLEGLLTMAMANGRKRTSCSTDGREKNEEKTCWKEPFSFIGEIAIALSRFCRGQICLRQTGCEKLFLQIGLEAMPIVALISFLTGMILGFVGVLQLARFGASIYVADLVGLSMAREMGAIMTAIVMAGRTGASFAATVGAMQVNEEVDALRTYGFSAIEFLVLPRLLITMCIMPMLCTFSVFIGIGGGMMVAVPMFDISAVQYIFETVSAVSAIDFLVGVTKGLFFAMLIGGIGCWHGMRCGRNAAGVGMATTGAVVHSITAIIVADALFALFCNMLHI
ncbi:MAG: ABC transporter permease [Puniceicoccales bacterium]|jgi:phospholipid/cholesterol/gamma-HCH transport system permease protein|nr:ABC transporter permease [Puniceicoccales bacterium]